MSAGLLDLDGKGDNPGPIEPGADFELVIECTDENDAPVDVEQTTNLVSNPSFEVPSGTIPQPPWSVYTNTGSSVAFRAADAAAPAGGYVAEVAATGLGASSVSMLNFSGVPDVQKISPGERAYVRGSMKFLSGPLDGTVIMNIQVRWQRADGNYNGEASVDVLPIIPPVMGQWYDLGGVSNVAPPGTAAVGMGLYVYSPNTGSGHAPVFMADAAMIVAGVDVGYSTPYFDGDTAVPGQERCQWTGAAHSSPSVRGPYTAAAQMRRHYATDEVALEFDVDLGANGVITISADAAATEAAAATGIHRGVWDLELTDAVGGITRLLQGHVLVNPQVTRA